jgi:hypothetical protein
LYKVISMWWISICFLFKYRISVEMN